MLPAQVQDNLQLQVVGYHAGNVHLSVVVPSELLPSIQTFFSSTLDLVKFISLKSKHVKSSEIDLDKISAREKSLKERNDSVLLHYQSYKLKGLDHRLAVKETSKHFSYLNCYQVDLIVKDCTPKKSRKRGN